MAFSDATGRIIQFGRNAPGSVTQTLTGSSGIATSLAFGSGGVVAGPLVGSTGIPSSIAFGSGGLLTLYLVGTAGIVSGSTFGADGNIGAQTISGSTGISTSVTFGSGGVVAGPLTGVTGIPSNVTFGSGGIVAGPISGATGVPSSITFGTGGTISTDTLTGVTGIPSSITFGSGGSVGGSVGGPLTGVNGIPSSIAFGSVGIVTGSIVGSSGITSSLAFGSGGALVTLIDGRPTGGIPSSFVFGSGGALLRGLSGSTGLPSSVHIGDGGSILLPPADHTNFRIFINSVDVTEYLQVGTLSTQRQLNFSASGNFTLYVETAGYRPITGQPVELWYWFESAWQKYFGGTIDSHVQVKPRLLVAEDGFDTFAVTIADWGKSLSRRLLNKTYSAALYGTLTSILQDLSILFESEGIHIVIPTDPGIALPDVTFAYTAWNAVLDQLAQLSGLNWQVDWDKNCFLYDRPSLIEFAPFDITDTDENIRNVSVTRSRGLYRNVQYIKAPLAPAQQANSINEVYTIETLLNPLAGDPYYLSVSELEVYDTRYTGRVTTVLNVQISRDAGVTFTDIPFVLYGGPFDGDYWIGQRNPNSIDFGWNLGGHLSDSLSPGDLYKIIFVLDEGDGSTPNLIVKSNDAEIASRQSIEGGSGRYEDVFEVTAVTDAATLLDIAQKLLDRFSVMGLELDYETEGGKLECGQQQIVTLAKFAITDEQGLIESISSQELDKTILRHVVKVSNAIQQQDALTAFQRLIARLKKVDKQIRRVITWGLAETIQGLTNPGLAVGNGLGSQVVLQEDFVCESFELRFRTPPTGSDAHIRVRANGTTIFNGTGYVVYTAGSTDTETFFSFVTPPLALAKGTVLDIDVLQKGATTPGKDGVAHLSGWV